MSECSIFEGFKTAKGYGQKKYKGRLWRAHRLVYTLAHGDIPKGLVVRHKCDNPSCVNLEHLELGTVKDNNHDKIKRGRVKAPKGDSHYNSKLTEESVRFILTSKLDAKTLSLQLGIDRNYIYTIRKGKAWNHIYKEVMNG